MSPFDEYTDDEGRLVTVAWLDDDWNVVTPKEATMVKVIFSDGEMAFFHVKRTSH